MGLPGLVLFVFLAASSGILAISASAQDASAQKSNAAGSNTSRIEASGASSLQVWIEAGVLRIKQSDRTAVVSPAITLAVRRATERAALSASTLLVPSNDNTGALQGTVGGEWVVPRVQKLRLESSGSLTLLDANAGDTQRSTSGILRSHVVGQHVGAFGTVGAGVIGRNGTKFHALKWDVGTWARQGGVTAVLTMRNSFTRDFPLVEASEFVLTDTVMYSVRDFEATVSARFRRLELQATGALRNGVRATIGTSNALLLSAVVQASSRFAVTLTAGKQLAEWLTGVPAARVVGASVRVQLLGGSATRGVLARRAAASPFATEITRHAAGGATVRIRVHAPANARVELSGTFNDWAVVSVAHSEAGFEHVLELPAGTHRIAIRINGGDWMAPDGLARVRDDLGGEAGLVVVP